MGSFVWFWCVLPELWSFNCQKLCLFCNFLADVIFLGCPPLVILACKIPEFWSWKLWNQNFVLFDSGNIHIKESKKPGFTFSIELRIKFVWSHGLGSFRLNQYYSYINKSSKFWNIWQITCINWNRFEY